MIKKSFKEAWRVVKPFYLLIAVFVLSMAIVQYYFPEILSDGIDSNDYEYLYILLLYPVILLFFTIIFYVSEYISKLENKQ